MTIDTAPHRGGGLAYYAKCRDCLYVSDPFGDEITALVLGGVHCCD